MYTFEKSITKPTSQITTSCRQRLLRRCRKTECYHAAQTGERGQVNSDRTIKVRQHTRPSVFARQVVTSGRTKCGKKITCCRTTKRHHMLGRMPKWCSVTTLLHPSREQCKTVSQSQSSNYRMTSAGAAIEPTYEAVRDATNALQEAPC